MKAIPSYEELLARCLSRVPGEIDKSEGSFIYDAMAPACMELAMMYMEVQDMENRHFADTATGEYLDRRTNERGINRKSATKALRLAEFNVPVTPGTRFEIEDVTYISKTMTTTQAVLECETPGTIGNKYTGALKPLTFVEGLQTAELKDIIEYGFDTEDDASLRLRYFERFKGEGFGGNVRDYIRNTKDIEGVGSVKVYPIWNGRGTVKVVLLDSDFNVPTQALVDRVQSAADPVDGQGKGFAPINHTVTVSGASGSLVDVSANITLEAGYEWVDVLEIIRAELNGYFGELRQTWESTQNITVRIAWIESKVLNVAGVLDVQNLVIRADGGTNVRGNIALESDKVPLLGEVIRLA